MSEEQRRQLLRDMEKANELKESYEYKSEMWLFYDRQYRDMAELFCKEEEDDRFRVRTWQ